MVYLHIVITLKKVYYNINKKQEGNEMMTLVIEHDNGKAGQRGFSDYQISEKAEAQKIISEYEESGIFIYSVNFCQF